MMLILAAVACTVMAGVYARVVYLGWATDRDAARRAKQRAAR